MTQEPRRPPGHLAGRSPSTGCSLNHAGRDRGAGFIGANLCQTLHDAPAVREVVALDDLSTGRRGEPGRAGPSSVVEGSILDPPLLAKVLDGADAVVHLAARPSVPRSLADPVATHEANATGTVNVLEAARATGRPQVVVASSSSVYGANPQLPKREDMATMPASPYAASKLAEEAYTLAYGRSFGLPVLAFRFFNVFGPLQAADHAYAAVVPAFIAPPWPTSRPGARRRASDPGLHLRGERGLGPHRERDPHRDRPEPGEPGLRVPGLAP